MKLISIKIGKWRIRVGDYLRNVAKQPEVLTKLQKQAEEAGTNKLSIGEIDQKVRGFRKKHGKVL